MRRNFTRVGRAVGRSIVPALLPAIGALLLVFPFVLRAAEVMPPPPDKYFNDYAGATKPATAARLNKALEDFERSNSSQIVVAVFPKMQTDSSLEDYVNRMFRAWKIGQRGKNNGVLLAVFVQDRKMRIEVGYGLEGAIPDAIAKRIISDEITPRFRSNDFDGGMSAGVNALMQAARGEYKGSGRTANDAFKRVSGLPKITIFVGMFFLIAIVFAVRRAFTGTVYGRRGRSSWSTWGWSGGGNWGGGGGGWSGGSSGGGFSGGGGDSGGGGASGSW